MHNFTPEELLLHLYGEASAELSAAIEKESQTNWSLREKLSVMQTAMKRLDSITVSPRTETVLNILNYAQEAAAEKAVSKS